MSSSYGYSGGGGSSRGGPSGSSKSNHQQQQHLKQLQMQRQQLGQQQQHRQGQQQNPSRGTTTLTRPPDLMKPKNIQTKQSTKSPTKQKQISSSININNTNTGATALLPSSPAAGANKRDSISSMGGAPNAATAPALPPALTPEQTQTLLQKCDWVDKTVYLTKQFLGGSTINGFLRATATSQRIKKQRARQTKATKNAQEQKAAAVAAAQQQQQSDAGAQKDKSDKAASLADPRSEEELKHEIMNARTAKKIRTEMLSGLQFCTFMHGTIESILKELNPSHRVAPLMGSVPPAPPPMATAAHLSSSFVATAASTNFEKATTGKKSSASSNTKQPPQQKPTTASPGDPTGSTLRRLRKRKFADISHPSIPEFESNGKRVPKKEYQWRLFEVLRFRALRQGDYVAARLSSRDLWILAQVQQPYAGLDMKPVEFLQLSEVRRFNCAQLSRYDCPLSLSL